MASGASGFDKLFPGLRVAVQTLSIISKSRYFGKLHDVGNGRRVKRLSDAGSEQQAPRQSAVLVTGGARDQLAHPYTSKVVLRPSRVCEGGDTIRRIARARVGIRENNLYENMAVGHPWIQKWQRRIQRVLTFAPLTVQGRGVFSYSSGLVPHRRPISVVVGAPIDVGPADPSPSREKVQAVHARYKKAVVELFETYRDIYDPKAADIVMI